MRRFIGRDGFWFNKKGTGFRTCASNPVPREGLNLHKTLIAMAAIFSIGLLGAFALFLQYNRYDLTDAGSGTVYKIDRKTGKTWMVVANKEVDVLADAHETAAENKAHPMDLGKAAFRVNYFIKSTVIDGVKKSKALGPEVTVEALIGSQISKLNRPLDLHGWDAIEKAPAVWLVSYTYDLGQGPQGYYFEIDTRTGSVQAISADVALQQKYGVTCQNFLCSMKKA